MEVTLYAEIYLFCIVIIDLVLYWTIHSNGNSASERWFKLVLSCFSGFFIANYFFTLINGVLLRNSPDLSIPWMLKSLAFILLCTGVYLWCVYTDSELGYNSFQPGKKPLLLLLPLVLPVVLVLSNFRTHLLFTISNEHIYTRGPHFHLLVLFLVMCTVMADIRILRATRGETDPVVIRQRWQLTSFPLCLIIAWLLSVANEHMPVFCVCITIEFLCLYIGSSNRQIMIDKLTQVNNRQNLNRYLSNKLHTHTDDLFLLMTDVDHFKQINDTYGHLEGDEALIRVSAALKQACTACRRHPYIARYGGDEFIIVAELSEKEVIELCTSIREKLQALNEAAGAPYPLSLSIGYAKWIEGMSPNRLIDVADYKLYKEKSARPRKSGRTGRTGRAGKSGRTGRA